VNLRRPFEVVTPTLDGEVLAVLARGDVEFSAHRVYEVIEGRSYSGVRKVLDRLVSQGVVLQRSAGRAFLFSLNREHLAAPAIEALAFLRLRLIERLRETIEHWEVAPSVAALFGSVARGEADESSDIDLFVLRPGRVDADDAVWRDQVMSLESAASSWTGNDARVLEYSENELARISRSEPVLREITREGIALYGDLQVLKARRQARGPS
jgi:predicted transcriptional regulator